MIRLCILFLFIVILDAHKVTVVHSDCPDGFHRWRTSCYKIFTDGTYSWPEAKVMCENIGGELVTIETSSENYFLHQWIRQRGIKMNLWINVNDIAVEGHWMWGPGKRARYTNFCAAEPNNVGGREHCGHIFDGNKSCWNDYHCSQHMGFICETKYK